MLDVALHADEENKGMDFILLGLKSSISAKLAGSPKEKRRRAPGITAAALKLKKKITQLRDLEIDAFNARKKEIGNEKERARLTDVIRNTKVQTKALRKELRRVIREKERKSTTDLRRRIGSFGLCDRRFHKMIRADCGHDRTLISQEKLSWSSVPMALHGGELARRLVDRLYAAIIRPPKKPACARRRLRHS